MDIAKSIEKVLKLNHFWYNISMNSIKYIKQALEDLDKEVEATLLDIKLSLKEKDNIMLPILRQQKVLKQTLEDLIYLQEHPPTPNQPCGISKYRED